MNPAQRIAIIGPTFPHRGGIVQHTTELAQRLEGLGMHSQLVSWQSQGPARLIGARIHPVADENHSEIAATERLNWWRPDSWLREGRRLALDARTLILVMTDVRQYPALATIARAFRRGRGSDCDIVAIVHNVLPHERFLGDSFLARRAVRVADRIVVHSPQQLEIAMSMGVQDVRWSPLPLHLPVPRVRLRPAAVRADAALHLLFFGSVRAYKGLPDLLRAVARASTRPELTVIGEFWQPYEWYRDLVRDLGLTRSVHLKPGYVPDAEVTHRLELADALVLPYRSATGSQMPQVAFAHGVPVIATDVADFSRQVRHGVDGYIIPPGDVAALTAAIDRLTAADARQSLQQNVRRPDRDADWDRYIDVLLGNTSRRSPDPHPGRS